MVNSFFFISNCFIIVKYLPGEIILAQCCDGKVVAETEIIQNNLISYNIDE